MPLKLLNPAWIIGFLAVIGVCAHGLHLPETGAAAFILLFAALITLLNPINGVAFLLISTPFLLGETGWPYYWIQEVLVYGTILAAIVHMARSNEKFDFPFKYLILLFIVASMASVPIDGKEFYYEFWAASWKEMFAWWQVGHPTPKIHYLRVLTNSLSGIALFLIAFQFSKRQGIEAIRPLLKASVVTAGAVCVIGVLMFYGIISKDPDTWHYLTLSVVGKYGHSITAFAYALHFLNQYLLIVLPISLYFIFLNRNRPSSLIFYVAVFAIIAFCLIQGGLRTAAMLLYITVLTAAGLYIFFTVQSKWFKQRRFIYAGFIVVALIGAFSLTRGEAFERMYDEIFKKINYETIEEASKFIDDPLYFLNKGIGEPRLFLWHTAVRMFADSPLLGIGLGRYTALFKEYYASDWYDWDNIGFASGATSHSLYFEILANQGAIGFIVWAALIGAILLAAYKAIKTETVVENRALIIAMLFSIISWLLLGLTHHIVLCRAIEILFWIEAGLLAGLSAGHLKRFELGRKTFTIAMLIIAAAFIYQVKLVSSRPIGEQFATGVYNWEGQPDGAAVRWTGKRGAVNVKVDGGEMIIPLAAPLPFLDKNPQKVTIWFGDHTQEVVFHDTAWKEAVIPVKDKKGSHRMLWLATEYTFNPKKENINNDGRNLGVMMKNVRWK